tara:strand:+ start:2622 stop:2966 length:345 start_codon:yes stop_codon:yes gene_type:complete
MNIKSNEGIEVRDPELGQLANLKDQFTSIEAQPGDPDLVEKIERFSEQKREASESLMQIYDRPSTRLDVRLKAGEILGLPRKETRQYHDLMLKQKVDQIAWGEAGKLGYHTTLQ